MAPAGAAGCCRWWPAAPPASCGAGTSATPSWPATPTGRSPPCPWPSASSTCGGPTCGPPSSRRRTATSRRAERFQVRLSQRSLARAFTLVGMPDYEQGPEATLGARAEQRWAPPWRRSPTTSCCADGAMLLVRRLQLRERRPAGRATSSCSTPRRSSAWPTAAPTWPSSATPPSRRTCSPTGPATARRGPRLALAEVIRRLTSQTADLYGFTDRGRVAVGLRADLNVIDPAALALEMPRAVHDLPAGGTRLLQGATRLRGHRRGRPGDPTPRRRHRRPPRPARSAPPDRAPPR